MRKLKITELKRLTTQQYKEHKKISLTVILDNVRSLHNVGAVFRSSDAFLVEKIYLCGITSTPPHNEIHKTALGAEESVDWEFYENTNEAVLKLKDLGYTILAIEQVENSIFLNEIEIEPNNKYAIILGNEVKGVQQDVINLCDGSIEIPQYGTKHSINVSVTAGIVIWEFAKKLLQKTY